MATWQINIESESYSTSVNMEAVREACADLIDGIEQENGRGFCGDWVYVNAYDVGEAVRRINELGYATDEDNAE